MCVSYQAVSKWETGVSSPDLAQIAPLTKLLHVTADELLCLNEPESDKRRIEIDTREWSRGVSSTFTDGFYERLNNPIFDPIRDKLDFIKN